jgi:hypothetical protein
MTESKALAGRPIVARSGHSRVSAVGVSLVVREWTGSGPSYPHVHRSDDEAWHVLESGFDPPSQIDRS